MKCLIIAAGRGSRLAGEGVSKPLVPVLGRPIIERVIRSAVAAGIDDFYVVTGYHGTVLREFLDALAEQCCIRMTHIANEDWQKGNGVSVLKAQRYMTEDFLLLMGDHLMDPSLLENLTNTPLPKGEITLAVDRNVDSPFVNPHDVTKVWVDDGKLIDIGKDVKDFNGYDTGAFLCSSAIFSGLAQSISEYNDDSLSGGVRRLAEKRKVNAFDVMNTFWIDVDDTDTLQKAEAALLKQLAPKPTDGPVARCFNRPVSLRISRYLAKVPVTPNQISLVAFLLSLFSAGLFCVGGYATLLAGGIVAQIASIIDGCDGEIARLKFLDSPFGGWFDAVLDRYADAFLLFGLTWHAYLANSHPANFLIGFMAIIGSFMLSYTADKYDARMARQVETGMRIGRDIRVLIILVGALLNQPLGALLLIAILMNLETVRRIYVCHQTV